MCSFVGDYAHLSYEPRKSSHMLEHSDVCRQESEGSEIFISRGLNFFTEKFSLLEQAGLAFLCRISSFKLLTFVTTVRAVATTALRD